VTRHTWTIPEVADVVGPAGNVRRCLAHAAKIRPIRRAVDVGCGFGRLTMVLREFAEDVIAFEREPAFVAEAQRLLPDIAFTQVASLDQLPAETGSRDFAMSFTVVQHMRDDDARAVVEEIKRVARGGFVLLTEETDVALGAGEAGPGVTRGRSEPTYSQWMAPFKPILQFKREIEPGYARPDTGTYMLFVDPRA
jgi:SAM-dependent methyltransferase